MRILIATWSCRRVGGTETYLGRIAARLAAAGHALAFGFEVDAPVERARVPLPDATLSFRLPADGLEQARAWKPDVIYAHGLLDPSADLHQTQSRTFRGCLLNDGVTDELVPTLPEEWGVSTTNGVVRSIGGLYDW